MAKKWTREEYAAFVQRLEPQAKKDPKGYRIKVGLLVALGYGFILLILATALVGVGFLIALFATGKGINAATIKILIVLGGFVLVTAGSLWVHFPRPDHGIPLMESDAPALFQSVYGLADKLQAPRPHHVLLVPEMNAAVQQRPRLGVLGWSENYLFVGLPLMLALSPAQFESVVAHELGHLRGGHSRFSAWIYRVRASWERMAENSGGGFVHWFLQWYAPLFNAYTFPLSREEEYEADRVAAMVATPRIAADALCSLPVINDTLDKKVWEPILKSMRTSKEPPVSLFVPMRDALSSIETTERQASEKSLQIALAEETGYGDTHPALTQRLRALGQPPRLPEPPVQSAADAYLGLNLPRLTEILDAQWREQAKPRWEAAHKSVAEEVAHMEILARKIEYGETVTSQERLQYAGLVEDYKSADEALPLFQALLDDPDVNLPARFSVGRLLLDKDDDGGLEHLEEVVRRDPTTANLVNNLVYVYHQRQGELDRAKEVLTAAMRQADKEDEASEERNSPDGNYLPHEVDEEKMAKLRAVFAKQPELTHVYLVRKEMKHFAETHPMFIVGYVVEIKGFRINNDSVNKEWGESGVAMNTALGETDVFKDGWYALPLTKDQNHYRKRMEKVADSLIYERPKPK